MLAKCPCYHCSGNLEFDAVNMGREIVCPHCGMPTKLYVPHLLPKGFKRRDVQIWIGLLLFVLVGVALALFVPDVFAVAGASVAVVCIALTVVFIYFLPAIIARHKRNATAILVLNLLAGWTFIGWVVAMVWACTVESDKKP